MLHLLRMKPSVIFIVLFLGVGLNPARAEDTAAIMEQARQDAEKLTLPTNKYSERGLKAAQETSDRFHSPVFQEKVEGEEQRLESEVFADYAASWKKQPQMKEEQAIQTASLTGKEKVYLFFSSSVPEETVQAYISTIANAGDPNVIPVMRGWVGSIADTMADAAYFSRILQKDPACRDAIKPCEHYQVAISLRPSLFTKYAVDRVPAVVYENEDVTYLIQGDAGLDYLLERINQETKSTTLLGLIEKIRGTY